MICHHCKSQCIRKGLRCGVQTYRCKACGKYQRVRYINGACAPGTDQRIITYTREGCGIRSIARILGISPTTVITRIQRIAARLRPSPLSMGRSYEVDELATYCVRKSNRTWLAYALDRTSGGVVAMTVGARTKRNLGSVVEPLLLAQARHIHTDGLDIYRSLIPARVHRVKPFGINRIERHNLTMRTRLKRLARRSICCTRNLAMLEACAAIHFWG